MLRRSHLYWGRLDKRRPVLVVSIDARNARADDILIVPCSTTIHEAPTHVLLGRGEGGLLRACVLKCEQMTTLPMSDVLEPAIGSLGSSRMREVERAILRAIGVPA